MPVADEAMYKAVGSFLDRQKLGFAEKDEQYCTKFTVQSGAQRAHVSVFNTGKLVVGGKDGKLKRLLDQMKSGLEAGEAVPGQVLPFEIERFPDTIRERVPQCDPVIVRFVEETIKCVQADALLGAAFLLGAASEKAVGQLIEAYVTAIGDKGNREKLRSRTNGRSISRQWDEFLQSYKSSKNRPTEGLLAQDIENILGVMFQFCRITRNEVGHPQIVPDLDKGVLLANLGSFVHYIERIYGLIQHFETEGVVV